MQRGEGAREGRRERRKEGEEEGRGEKERGGEGEEEGGERKKPSPKELPRDGKLQEKKSKETTKIQTNLYLFCCLHGSCCKIKAGILDEELEEL